MTTQLGPCAKQVVTCTLVHPDGRRWVGRNDVENPQRDCPRCNLPSGVGYDMCRDICRQKGHAEEQALNAAGLGAVGCTAYVEGIHYICMNCQVALASAGVKTFVLGAPQIGQDERALFNAAIDEAYPIPDTPHTSVMQRANYSRAAFTRGWDKARAALAHPSVSPAPAETALRLVQKLSTISMRLAADLVNGADYTFKGHDYLDRDFVCERVVKWRQEWDATFPERNALIEATRAAASQAAPAETYGEALAKLQNRAAELKYALVPMHLTRAMQSVMDKEDWRWEDLLAAAEAITESQYDEIAAAPAIGQAPTAEPVGCPDLSDDMLPPEVMQRYKRQRMQELCVHDYRVSPNLGGEVCAKCTKIKPAPGQNTAATAEPSRAAIDTEAK